MEYQEQTKSHRFRTIILAILIIAAVIIIGVGLVVAAMNSIHSSASPDESRPSEPIVSQSSDRPAVAEPSSTSTSSSPADQYQKRDSSASASPSSISNSTSSNDIPSTGPEDMLFSALLIGVAVFLLGHNLQLAKSRRTVI